MPTHFDAWFERTPLGTPMRYEVAANAVVIRLPRGVQLADTMQKPAFAGVFPTFELALAIPDLGFYVLEKVAPTGVGLEPMALTALLVRAGLRTAAWAVRDHPQGALMVAVGEIVLAFRASTSLTQVEQLVGGSGWAVRRSLAPYAPFAFVLSPPGSLTAADLGNALRSFRGLPGAIASYPVAPGDASQKSSHALPNMWHLAGHVAQPRGAGPTPAGVATVGANVRAAWPASGGGVGVTIAILEGDPVDDTHPQLTGLIDGQPKLAQAVDMTVEGASAPMPSAHSIAGLHGTACAGVAMARGAVEVDAATGDRYTAVGIAPNAQLLAIRCAAGVGSLAEADAIAFAADRADVISCSWGPKVQPPAVSRLPDHSRWALEYALSTGRQGLGCVVCFSTGNDASRTETTDLNEYVSCPGVIGVGACDCLGDGTRYSVRGSAVALVFPSSADTASAPHQRIATIQPGVQASVRYLPWIGRTSAACAATAGAAALLLAACPKLSAREVATALRGTCQQAQAMFHDAPPEEQVGRGRIDCDAALRRVLQTCVGRPRGLKRWPPDAEPLLASPAP